jgi:Domain of unknown function (DUF1995)
MRRISLLLLGISIAAIKVSVSVSLAAAAAALIPSSPQEQTRRAIRSIRDAIQQVNNNSSSAADSGQPSQAPGRGRRLYVDYLLPLPIETKAEDIDPWPGGLAQMYPYAERVVQEILAGVVDEAAGPSSSVVLSQADCCGFFVQESKTLPKYDIAAIVFPSVDQLDKINEIDTQLVGPDRTLILFNKQFQRPADFGFAAKDRAQRIIFDRYHWGFAFQEMSCRGEDIKLTFEYSTGWKSSVICNEDAERGSREIALLEADPQRERPTYDVLEKKINQVLPEPLWMRKMGEAERKGFKFQRRGQ